MADGRFAPSPTGSLHLGSLRTAIVAWLFARGSGSRFVLRIEDLDRVASRAHHEEAQRRDLLAIGIDWDGEPVRQSEREHLYAEAFAELERAGLTYPCWCTRREIQQALTAPHGAFPEGAYPGTCDHLSAAEVAEREASGRPAAIRVRAHGVEAGAVDVLHGPVTGVVDDFVVRRNDGAFAYNLAVVVDDAAQRIREVVRGDDLLDSTPRQAWLARTLGLEVPRYAHVPLVLGPDGVRLAKRHGDVTLDDLATRGWSAADVRDLLTASLGMGPEPLPALAAAFDPQAIPRHPWTLPADLLARR